MEKSSSSGERDNEREKEGGRMLSRCDFCFGTISLNAKQSYISGMGLFHSECIEKAFERDKERRDLKKIPFKILFIDQGNRNYQLYERLKEAKDHFPQMDWTIDFKSPAGVMDLLRNPQGSAYDFIFLDAPHAGAMSESVHLISKWDQRRLPRGVFFYGYLSSAEQKTVGDFCLKLQMVGVDARIIPLSEVNFSLLQERRISLLAEEKGEGV